MLPSYLAMILDESEKSKFEVLYKNYQQTMFWAALAILNDQNLAEDAVHDAFLRILKNLQNIFPEDCNKTRAFVVMIVRNIAMDILRKQKRSPEVNLDELEDYLLDDKSDPEEIVINRESRQDIIDALGKMKKSYVDIIALQVSYRLSQEEIAYLLGISPESARVRLHRARRQLALYLKGEN